VARLCAQPAHCAMFSFCALCSRMHHWCLGGLPDSSTRGACMRGAPLEKSYDGGMGTQAACALSSVSLPPRPSALMWSMIVVWSVQMPG
jgi:hypothetical protein